MIEDSLPGELMGASVLPSSLTTPKKAETKLCRSDSENMRETI